jgi:hypothetical protein
MKMTKKISKEKIKAAEDAIRRGMGDDKLKPYIPPPESNSAAILYKRMPGDMILVTGFRNILTAEQIEQKYGKDIFTVYMAGDFVTGFYGGDGKFGIFVGFGVRIMPGKVYKKKDFAKLVATMKSAGKLLAEIMVACKSSEVRMVEL